MIIVIKEVWGWVIKDFDGTAPANKQFKIFENREKAENYINNYED